MRDETPLEPVPNLTPEEMVKMQLVGSDEEWDEFCAEVKKARGGDYPDDWYEVVLKSGLGKEIHLRWGSDYSLKVTSMDLVFGPRGRDAFDPPELMN
jgi:hypothetical protein